MEETPAIEFECSPALGQFAKAFSVAQGKMGNAAATAENPHFKSTYADLASIVDAVRGPLAEQGIARHQALMSRGPLVGVRTALIHSSGEWVASTVWCASPGTPQGLGSVVTYLRRYSLAAAVGIAQEDDDAESAMARAKAAAPKEKPAAKLDPKVQARIKILQAELSISDEEWRERLPVHYGVRSSAELTAAQAQDLIGRLEARKGTGAKVAPGASEAARNS